MSALQCGQPEMPTKEQDRLLRKKELQLMIDHRLGTEFPAEKREALWRASQEIERRRLRLAIKHTILPLNLLRRSKQANSLAAYVVNKYARVIGRSDAERFFGLSEGEDPTLPIDV